MERDAHYVAVGAFILLVIAMGVGFVLWYTDANDGREYKRYEIYFTGSVSGLDRGSPVRFLGVDVGRVRRLAIDSSNATRVHVVVEVDQTAPISAATRASLGLQGVTGLLYVNLKEASDVDRNAPLQQGSQYPVIEAVESDFDAFLASLPEMMGRANTLLERISRVVSDDNLNGIAESIKGMRDTMVSMPKTAKDVQQLVTELRSTVVELHGAAESLRGMTNDARPEVQTALARMNDIANNLAEASSRVDRFTQKSEVQLGNFTEQGLFELERLMRETRQAAREFRDLSRSLQENPSQILYEPQQSGVEIKP
ncbi:MlaD family protein [Steroidobacter sp.]|uniref:MlaD family protein n=1 Tax=Steroidobacter sp. TaxID=1978227 RepID=UPI001A574620|nr:MlaD family protein [Steroidobacter sp.]MBL8271460.1 MCE family protein [Steroidobacter sp.]